MESKPLVLTDPNMLAEFVRQSELKTFFEKRFAAPEDLGSILFRDGAVVDGFSGTQFSIGGFWENLKGVIGGSHHYEILLADLKPFQAVIPVRTMSRDQVEIVGEATFELQLNPEKITSILGLMRGVTRNERELDSKAKEQALPGRKALTVPDVIARLEPHFRDRVFAHVIGRHDAEELRGSRGMQDQVQADLMTEAERILGDVGVMVRSATVNFAMNEAERLTFEKAKIEREEAMKDYQLDLLKRQVTREADSTSFKLASTTDQAKLKQASEDEIRHLVMNSEVAFVDAREGHKRRQEFEALDHEARLLLAENKAKTEIALGEISDATLKSQATLNLRKSEFALQGFETEFRLRQAKLEGDFRRAEELADSQTKLGTTTIDTQAEAIEADEEHRQAARWAELAARNKRVDSETEVGHAKGMAEADNLRVAAAARADVDRMLAAGSLSPEQLMQYMPGISESAAQAAIARAQAESLNSERMIELAREMTADSRAHEHQMFETGMKGGTGMAAGLGGKGEVPKEMGGSPPPVEMVECPECKTANPAKAKFCKTCGTQLRN